MGSVTDEYRDGAAAASGSGLPRPRKAVCVPVSTGHAVVLGRAHTMLQSDDGQTSAGIRVSRHVALLAVEPSRSGSVTSTAANSSNAEADAALPRVIVTRIGRSGVTVHSCVEGDASGWNAVQLQEGQRLAVGPMQADADADALQRADYITLDPCPVRFIPTLSGRGDKPLQLSSLAGGNIHVLRTGVCISSGMVDVWRAALQKLNVHVTESAPAFTDEARTGDSIIIVDDNVTFHRFCAWLPHSQHATNVDLATVTVGELHTASWLQACLKTRRRLPADAFVWRPAPEANRDVDGCAGPNSAMPRDRLGVSTAAPSSIAVTSNVFQQALDAGDAETALWPYPAMVAVAGGGMSPLRCPYTCDELHDSAASILRVYPWLQVDEQATVDDGSAAETRKRPRLAKQLTSFVPQINVNAHLTKPLSQLLRAYEVCGADVHRRTTLERAIGTLRTFPKTITKIEDVRHLPGFGRGTVEKIEELLQTGRLQRADALNADAKVVAPFCAPVTPHHDCMMLVQVQALMQFCDVLWVGPSAAARLYASGMRTIDDLRRNSHLLNHQQRVGAELFELLQERIARDESKHIQSIVCQHVHSVLEPLQLHEKHPIAPLCVCGGSYRRGHDTSSDLDFILAPPAPLTPCDLLPALYRSLKRAGYLSHDLLGSWMTTDEYGVPTDVDCAPCDSASEDHDEKSCATYFGVWTHTYPEASSTVRAHRIDLKCFCAAQAPYALISWTGNTLLNRSLRLYASKLGYELDDKSLLPTRVKASGAKVASAGVPAVCEADVFAFLGLRFIPTAQRNVLSTKAGLDAVACKDNIAVAASP